MRGLMSGLFLAFFALSACGTSMEQALRPDQPTSAETNSGPQNKQRQGLVVTDNPYMISSERLEQMNKGGFGAYQQVVSLHKFRIACQQLTER